MTKATRRGRHVNAATLRGAGAAAIAVALGACAPLGAPQLPPAVVTVRPAPESALLSQVAANGLYEIEVSRLAAARATSPRVRSLAHAVASHRAQARQELAGLMRARGLAV